MSLLTQTFLPSRTGLLHWAARPAAWCLLTTLFFVGSALGWGLGALPDWLGDSDDALRLVTVRELIAGAPWFDTTLPRVGAPEPLLSHWSRLIDLPLVSLVALFKPLLGAEGAELATRIVWPALLFFGLLLVVVRDADRRAGPWTAAFALVFALTCATALVQFKPGRVDHHNAQILCAIAGVLLLVRSLDAERYGIPAGLLLGLGLAIGYEALALIVPALALAACATLWEPRKGPGVLRAAAAATITMLVALLVTGPPGRWLDIRCDALSLNLPVLAAFGTVGLWGALRLGQQATLAMRLLPMATAGIAGAITYAALEPACLAGPFGQVDPAVRPIWLDGVMEGRNVLWLLAEHPAAALTFVAFVLAGAAAQVAIWLRRGDAATGVLTAIVCLSALLGCWQIKLMPYASWLAILPLAIYCAGLRNTQPRSSPLLPIAAVALLNQATLGIVIGTAVSAVRSFAGPIAAAQDADMRACSRSSSVGRLAALPPGLVATDVDLGPFVVATTPHRVVAAPYHRLDKGILANHAILGGSPDKARDKLAALGVDYVALCAPAGLDMPPQEAGSLRARLLGNERIPFLQELAIHPTQAIRVWRVVPR